MKISARNQVKGTVKSIEKGSVNAIVTLDASGTLIKGTISLGAVSDLELKEGVEAVAIVKATEVLVGVGDLKLSARNQIGGKVTSIKEGAVNGIVTITSGEIVISSTISMEAIKELGLTVGCDAVAVIKSTSVMFGVL